MYCVQIGDIWVYLATPAYFAMLAQGVVPLDNLAIPNIGDSLALFFAKFTCSVIVLAFILAVAASVYLKRRCDIKCIEQL